MALTYKQKYKLLLDINQKIRNTLDLDQTLENILDMIKTNIDYDAAGIFVLNQDLVQLRYIQPRQLIAGVIRRGFDEKPLDDDLMITEGKGIIGHVISTAESLIIPDVHADPRYIEGRSSTQSEIAVPITRNNRSIGALDLESDQLSAFGKSDLETLEFFAASSAIAIEKAILHRQLLEKELLDKQIELARNTQSRLFPESMPQIAGFDIAGLCIPAEKIGGDYFDFIPLPNNRLGVAVADVSGHGISAALLTTAFRGLLRTNAVKTTDPSRVAKAINQNLPDFCGDSGFVTAIYGFLDPTESTFTFVCCGQQPPLMLKMNQSPISLSLCGPALGITLDAHFFSERQSLLVGDILALFTDGVVELTNPEQEQFGIKRLALAMIEGQMLSSNALIEKVVQITKRFSGRESYEDDFTLVIIRRL